MSDPAPASDPLSGRPEKLIPDAYHGTTRDRAESILKVGFHKSNKPKLYLGTGVYFYEGCLESAWKWARDNTEAPHAVLCCVGKLGRCLDFTLSAIQKLFYDFYIALRARYEKTPALVRQLPMLTQSVVIEMIAEKIGVETVRAEQHKSDFVVPGGAGRWNIFLDSRIYICVRNISNIIKTALVP